MSHKNSIAGTMTHAGTGACTSHVTNMRAKRLRRGQPGAEGGARGAGSKKMKFEREGREGRGGRGDTMGGDEREGGGV